MRTLLLAAACGVVCGILGYWIGISSVRPFEKVVGRARSEPSWDEPLKDQPVAADLPPSSVAEGNPGPAAALEDVLRLSFPGEAVPEPVLERARQLCDQNHASAESRAAAQAAREERDRRDVLQMEAAGEMARVLETLAGKKTTLPLLAADGDRLLALLRGPAKGPAVSEPDLARLESGEIADGTTVLLPAGKLARSWQRSGKAFPSNVTLSGMGVDRTFLDIEIDPDRPVLGLTIENMTVTSQDLVDAEKALTLILRNVRAAGYNTGAGGSQLLDIRGAHFALLAENCVFDGSVGRGGSRHGTPFSISAPAIILRFTRCDFIENDAPVRIWGTATIHFEACRFLRNGKARVAGAVYRDCTFEGNGDDK